jgi:nicotinamidase-related amidase
MRRRAQRLHHGYNVALLVDAMTDMDADTYRHSVEKIFPCLGETATTDNVLKLLTEDNC